MSSSQWIRPGLSRRASCALRTNRHFAQKVKRNDTPSLVTLGVSQASDRHVGRRLPDEYAAKARPNRPRLDVSTQIKANSSFKTSLLSCGFLASVARRGVVS